MKTLYEFPGYRIIERLTTIQEYSAIVQQISPKEYLNDSLIENAIDNSLYGVVAENDDQAIGMGRIIGDKATLYLIQDVCVLPAFRGLGIELAIMDSLMIHLEAHAPDRAVIASLSSITNVANFEQLGFRTTAPDAFGMFRVIDRTAPDRQQIPWK